MEIKKNHMLNPPFSNAPPQDFFGPSIRPIDPKTPPPTVRNLAVLEGSRNTFFDLQAKRMAQRKNFQVGTFENGGYPHKEKNVNTPFKL